MIIKTGELEGAALDWAVAKATGMNVWLEDEIKVDGLPMVCADNDGDMHWSPSDDWLQGGLLIEKYRIGFHAHTGFFSASACGGDWDYSGFTELEQEGVTHLIAAMRAIVAAEIGDSVDIPDELYQSV